MTKTINTETDHAAIMIVKTKLSREQPSEGKMGENIQNFSCTNEQMIVTGISIIWTNIKLRWLLSLERSQLITILGTNFVSNHVLHP